MNLLDTQKDLALLWGPGRKQFLMSEVPLSSVRTWPAIQTLTTVMREVVSVPVLSEQMVVAPPIVSHADRCRTCAHTIAQVVIIDKHVA